MSKPVIFYSEGVKLAGDLFLPADVKQGDQRAGIVLCHGYTGVRSIYLPDNARVLAEAGYVVMSFDYKGWGDSEGPKSRLAPYSRVADVQAALTFLGAQPEVDAARLGIRHELWRRHRRLRRSRRSAREVRCLGAGSGQRGALDAPRTPPG
jgi:hypothetical protein